MALFTLQTEEPVFQATTGEIGIKLFFNVPRQRGALLFQIVEKIGVVLLDLLSPNPMYQA